MSIFFVIAFDFIVHFWFDLVRYHFPSPRLQTFIVVMQNVVDRVKETHMNAKLQRQRHLPALYEERTSGPLAV